MWLILNSLTLVVLAGAAWKWGAAPERLAVAVLVGMQVADRLYHLIAGRPALYHTVDLGHLIIDVAAAAAMLALCLQANRIYPLCLAAFQLISVLAHLGRLMSPSAAGLAYAYLTYVPFYGQALTIAAGIAIHRHRVRRSGKYPPWRNSSPVTPAMTPKR